MSLGVVGNCSAALALLNQKGVCALHFSSADPAHQFAELALEACNLDAVCLADAEAVNKSADALKYSDA